MGITGGGGFATRRGKTLAFGRGPVRFAFGGGQVTFTFGEASAAFASEGSPGGAVKEAPEQVMPALDLICECAGEREI